MKPALVPFFALKFLMELVGWAGTGVFAYQVVRGGVLGWVLAFAVPAVVIALWSRFVAPRASKRLPAAPRLVVELAVYALAAVGLWMLGWTVFAIVYAVVVVVVDGVLLATKSFDYRP